jgi:hypothetical protein
LLKEIEKLLRAALIKKNRRIIQLHRLTQATFLHHTSQADLEQFLESASILLCAAFPKQDRGNPMTKHWETCQKYILHVQSLARHMGTYLSTASDKKKVPPSFVELMSNAAW